MTDKPRETRQAQANLLAAIWDTLGNLKFAAVLILIFTAATLLGTFIPQGEAPGTYTTAYGESLARVLRSLELTNLYYSSWYRFLIVVIAASVFVCTINRYKITIRRSRSIRAEFGPSDVEAMRSSKAIPLRTAGKGSPGRIAEALRRLRYGVVVNELEDRACIAGHRRWVGNWGMFVVHVSLLLIVVGALVGAKLGFTGYMMWIPEGESSDTCFRSDYSHMIAAEDPHNPGSQAMQPQISRKKLPFSIYLQKFHLGVTHEGTPTEYRSSVRVIQRGKTQKRFDISTNRPLHYRGISFFQSDFSVAAVTIDVTGPQGKVTSITWPVEAEARGGPMAYRVVPSQGADIPTPTGSIFIIPAGFAPNYDPDLPFEIPTRGDLPANPAVFLYAHPTGGSHMGMRMPEEIGWVSAGKSKRFSGYDFSLARVQLASALGVSRNPAMPVIYLGFVTLVLGLIFAFYVRHRIIRVCLWEKEGRAMASIGATERLGEADFDREFAEIDKALPTKEGS
jgi:cytochrome c biogenesis protein